MSDTFPALRPSVARVLSALVLGIAVLASRTAYAQTRAIVADSEAEFSCVQGQDGWHYGYFAGPFTSQDFQPMTQCGPDILGSYTGNAWMVDPRAYWTSIRSVISFPNGPASCGRQPVEQWAVRRWVSNVAGPVTIAGTVADAVASFDGFTAHIIIDGVRVFSQVVNRLEEWPYHLDATVNAGATVDFAIQPHASDCNDHAKFTATITADAGQISCDVSLTVNPATVLEGQTTTVNWRATGAISSGDSIGLYRAGGQNLLAWFTTGGASTGSMVLSMIFGQGDFEFRYLPKDAACRTATSNPVTVMPPNVTATLSATPTIVPQQQPITVSWQATGPISQTDWIGLFPDGAVNTAYVCWFYTGGAPSGTNASCPRTLVPEGIYEFRYCLRDGYECVAKSNSLTVVPPPQPERPSVTLAADPTMVFVGQPITVSWQATGAITQRDWIGLFEKGSPNTQYQLCWFYTAGAPSGSHTCPAPNFQGTFEFRYCLDNGYECVAVSNPVTVKLPDPPKVVATLTAEPPAVQQQQGITVTWQATGPIVSLDWIGFYRVGSGNTSFLTWFVTGAAPSGSSVVPAAYGPGTFEFRYCLDFGYTCVAASNPVTVQ
jgi:hypothetical protein